MYLTNVEGICRRFVDEKRESLLRMKETTASFKAYWASQTANDKKALVQHKGSDMLKVRPAVLLTHCLSVRATDLACFIPLLLYRCGSPVRPINNHSVAVAEREFSSLSKAQCINLCHHHHVEPDSRPDPLHTSMSL